MKHLFIVGALLLTLSSQAFAGVKVGIVNIQKVITSISEGKSVLKTLEKSFKTKQKELKTEEEEIKKLQTSFQKQDMVLSEKAKIKKEQELRMKIGAFQKKTMQYQKDIQKQEAQLKQPILEKLKPVIDEVSKSEKVSMTFELTSSPVVYAEEKVDITEKVIKAYDKKYKK